MFIAMSNNNIFLNATPSPVQVRVPSLAFVVKLGQKKTHEYRRAAKEHKDAQRQVEVSRLSTAVIKFNAAVKIQTVHKS